MLKEVTPFDEECRLNPNLTTHHHLICRLCHWIFDLTDEDVEPLRLRGDLPRKFQIERFDILGICLVEQAGVEVNVLLDKLVRGAGAEFIAFYYSTILRVNAIGFEGEDLKEIIKTHVSKIERRAGEVWIDLT